MITLGLCCINTELRAQKPPVFNSRSCVRRTYSVQRAKELALQNVADLVPMLEYNNEHNIRCFRISSDIFPHFTDDQTESYTIDFAREGLRKAGELARKYGIRLLMHPGQYNQVGAVDPGVFSKTAQDLGMHADILDAVGCDSNGVLIVHGGGVYGDKEATKQRWVEQYFQLPENVQKRLVLEHCERSYSLVDVLEISEKVAERGGTLPVVYDSHHHECYKELHPDEDLPGLRELLPQVLATWGSRRPVMHVSNQGEGRVGHHSNYIYRLPRVFGYVRRELGVEFELEVEAKMKEQAIFRLRERYPKLLI